MRWVMVRPSPAPPCSRVVELSSCVNGSKMAASLSVGIPGPWSEIWATAQPCSRHHRTSTWPPRGENLIAFASRLTNTCSTRSRTPSTTCGSAGGRGVSITPCSPANAATVSSPAATLSSSDTGSSRNSIRPASRRERSSRSFTNRISRSAFRRAISSSSRGADSSGPAAPASSRDNDVFTDVIGVRSSWLTTETNSDFARSTATSWVTFRYSTICPSGAPPRSRTGATTRW